MAIDPTKVPRFAHGSRVPGWDDAADLTKDPAVVPDPATTPVPEHVRAEIEAQMAQYPDRRADAIHEAMVEAAGADPDVHVKPFECLGACDIAPMASVDGEYVGPLEASDCALIVEDVKAGRPVLEAKQLRRRKAAGT